MLLFLVLFTELLSVYMIGNYKKIDNMIKDFIEKSLASFYNKCRQTKGTYEGTDFALSVLLTCLVFATFLLSLSFIEQIFGWPLASWYNNMFPTVISAAMPFSIICCSIIYYCLKHWNVRTKVCEKYTSADRNPFFIFLGILSLPIFILLFLL